MFWSTLAALCFFYFALPFLMELAVLVLGASVIIIPRFFSKLFSWQIRLADIFYSYIRKSWIFTLKSIRFGMIAFIVVMVLFIVGINIYIIFFFT